MVESLANGDRLAIDPNQAAAKTVRNLQETDGALVGCLKTAYCRSRTGGFDGFAGGFWSRLRAFSENELQQGYFSARSKSVHTGA